MPKKRQEPFEILAEATERLKARSSGMSLRAVAAKLEVSPSYWSKVLNGKRPLSRELLAKVVKVLPMDPQQIANLHRTLLQTHEEKRLAPSTGLTTEQAESPISEYKNLGTEHFWILERWYYIPLLNAFTLSDFQPTSKNLAQLLGLTKSEVDSAVEHFLERGLLEKKENKISRTELLARFPTSRSHDKIRKYHREFLKLAYQEIGNPKTFEQRSITGVCFAGSSSKFREAQVIMEEAMYRAANLVANEPERDEIYQLSVQLYPLTKK